MLGDLRDLLRGRVSDAEFEFSRHYATKPIEVSYSGRPWPIHYLTLGDPKNPTIFLFHGVGSRAGQFFEYTHIMQLLAACGFYCVAPDLPGHGRTPSPTEDEQYKLSNLGGMLAEFTREIIHGSPRNSCLWVAHSLAAGAAMHWLGRHRRDRQSAIPELRGVCFVSLPASTSVPFLMMGATLPGATLVWPRLMHSFGRPYLDLYLRSVAHSGDRRRELVNLYYPSSPSAVRAKIKFIRENAHLIVDPRSILAPFKLNESPLPFLFMHGENDTLFLAPYVRGLVREHFPSSKFITLRDAGHNLPDDLPEEFVNEVSKFARAHLFV